MTRGILQLATTGMLPLHLEYRISATPPEQLRADAEDFEPTEPSNTHLITGSFEATYGKY